MNTAASDYPPSWYLATANGLADYPSLKGTVSTDICVVGGGYTGLSTALHLAERGYSVVLLESNRVGWGASGRNGGQIGTGQRIGESELEQQFGAGTALQLFDLANAGRELVKDLVQRHAIDCDLRFGQVICAAKPSHLGDLEARAAKLARDYAYPHQRMLDLPELRSLVDSPVYYGGVLDSGAVHLHPLNLALGLARAAVAAGVQLHEQSAATGYTGTNPVLVRTAAGVVRARYLVLACNGYLGGLQPQIADYILPINNFLLATAPLGSAASGLIAEPGCAHDTLFVVNYFRRSLDGRLIFGGGETYRRRYPADLKAFVRRRLLRVFPQLAGVPVDYAWGGTVAVTMSRLPHLGRLAPDVYFAQGYSGHGIATATLAGQLMAEAIAGTNERFDVFARVAPRRLPGGTLLRRPGLVLGMLWFALRDRL
ncbi:MAG: FAD-binding oxidoreductase [Gammaproteobacteria bacterium]